MIPLTTKKNNYQTKDSKRKHDFFTMTFSVPDHCISQTTSKCSMNRHFCTNQITLEEEGIHYMSLSQLVSQHLVILQKKKKKKILLLQSKLSSFENFLILETQNLTLETTHVCEGMTFLHLGHLCVKSCLLKLCGKG